MPHYSITHHTAYHFDEPLAGVKLLVCLQPLDCLFQTLEFHQVVSIPLPIKRVEETDAFGNIQQHLSFRRPLQKIEVTSVSTVSVNGRRSQLENTPDAPDWQSLFAPEELALILPQALAFAPEVFLATSPLVKPSVN